MKMATNKPKQILELRPSSEIVFEGPFEHVVTSYLELSNPSENKVCFKVKTTAPRRYCVRPNSGVVEPSCKVKIAIMLQPIEQESQAERNKHKFMVQSTIIRDNVSNLDSVWQEASPEEIMDSKLRCVFQMPDVGSNADHGGNIISSSTTAATEVAKEATATSTSSSGTKMTASAAINSSATASPRMPTTTPASMSTSTSKQQSGQMKSSESIASSPASQSRLADKATGTGSTSKRSIAASFLSPMGDESFLQPMSNDHKLVLISLAMLFIGVILGKYII